jgi:hypothetical protein
MATLTTTISYGEPTGTIVATLGTPGPQGQPGPQGIQGVQGDPGVGVPTGGLINQYLVKASGANFDTKWSNINLEGYALESWVTSYFYPRTGNPDSFATQAWVIGQNYLTEPSLAAYATMAWVNNELMPYATQTYVNSLGFITASALSPYLLSSDAATTYQTLSGMSSYAPKTSPTFTGVVTIPSGANISGYLTTATASAIYAPKANPTLTGTVTVPTPATSSNTTVAASTAFVKAQGYATLNQPTFTGVVTIPSGAVIFGYLATSTAAATYLSIANAATTYAVTARGLPASGTTGQVLSKVSGTSYDVAWSTFTQGDRYLTTSTTSNSVSNGAKTFTVETGLSYTPTQDCTIAYNAANHMHATVTTYNSSTGVLVVDVNQHSGAGTYTTWTVNVGGAVPSTSIAWGSITGTIGDQSDLSTILNSKLASADAATTYQTLSGMSSYLTTSIAASTYQTLSGMSSYLTTSTAASTYQPISGMSSYPTFTDADGRYLQLSGGAMATNSSISIAGTTYDSLMASDIFGVEKTSDTTQNASLGYSTLTINSTSSGTYGTTTNAGQVTSSALTLTQSGSDSYGTITHAGTYGLDQFTSVVSGVAFSSTLTVAGNGISASQTNLGTTTSFSLNSSGVQWNNGTVNGQFGPGGLQFADGSTQTTAYTGGGSVSWGSISGSISSQTDLQSALDGKYSTSNPSGFVDGSGAINAISNGYTSSVTNYPSGGQFLKFNGGSLEWASPGGGGTPPYSEAVWIYNNWYSATIQTVYTTSYSYVNVLTF